MMNNVVNKLGNCDVISLSGRELEIMELLAEGFTYAEVAERLVITVNTVKFHMRNLLSKTGYRNAVSLVSHAVASGIIEIN